MKRFKHIDTTTAEEAVSALECYKGNAKVIAGGTDLLGQMKDNILPEFPEALVNLKNIPDMDYIRNEKGTVTIGALTRLEDIATNDLIREHYPVLAEAAAKTASPHIREQGTIAGNICQSNRCWYYWVPDNRFNCIRKGGTRCYAYVGEGKYHSIFGSTRVNGTPCKADCPAGVNIPAYMAKLREDDIASAAEILMDSNPFPAITGRICPHTCETRCNRIELDEAVAVRNVERFIGDYILGHLDEMYLPPAREDKGNIAVVGSGPAGLSCAWYLRRAGYTVTVFEMMEEAGGMLTYGIPAYRLPKDIVRKQIEALTGAGIRIVTGESEGKQDVNRLAREYDAVYLATGAWKERMLEIEGENLMISGTEFLRKPELIRDSEGKKVAVIGGGNVAMDVARTLLRKGAQPVIVYRRTRNEMPAIAEEIERAEEEGIPMQFLTLPTGAYASDGKTALQCVKMKLGERDESGRPVPEPINGSAFTVDYDAVIKATGEVPDHSYVPAELLSVDGRMTVDGNGLVDGNIFAGGDCISGPTTVVTAIASGRTGAESIDRYLDGSGIRTYPEGEEKDPATFDMDFMRISERNDQTELSVEERIKSVETEDTGTLDLEEVLHESCRCFNCGCLAVNSSDLAPALIALDAKIVTTDREIESDSFFTVEGEASTVLQNEIVTSIVLPAVEKGATGQFIKFALRKSIDFPLVNCAVVLTMDGTKVTAARICLNGVYNTPLRVKTAEDYITGKSVTEDTAGIAGEIAVQAACPLPDNTYKVQIAKTLVKRAILACAAK